MVKRFFFFGVLALLALFVFLQSRSSTYQVERSVHIGAPQQVVFAALDDLHRWPSWSPWDALDPNLKRVFGGAERGPGASFAWDGNPQVGRGRITISDDRAPSTVEYTVAFDAPLEATMKYEFRVAPDHEGSKLSWVFQGSHPFWAKLLVVFRDLDGPLGNDMSRGLETLKKQLEAQAR